MATTHAPTAATIGHTLADLLRDHPDIRAIWASDAGDYVDLWIVTAPITHERELELYDLETRLHERFGDRNPHVHVAHAGLYDSARFVFEPPAGAEPIPLPR